MSRNNLTTKKFNTKKSIRNATSKLKEGKNWSLKADGNLYVWNTKIERLKIVRNGIPYDALETISKRLNRPIKVVLSIVGIPQTTYNNKKSKHSLLDSRDSELVIMITELMDYGMEVFNNEEEKFQRWLKKPNISLGNNSPESLLDTITGINEVRFALNRIEFGNLA